MLLPFFFYNFKIIQFKGERINKLWLIILYIMAIIKIITQFLHTAIPTTKHQSYTPATASWKTCLNIKQNSKTQIPILLLITTPYTINVLLARPTDIQTGLENQPITGGKLETPGRRIQWKFIFDMTRKINVESTKTAWYHFRGINAVLV